VSAESPAGPVAPSRPGWRLRLTRDTTLFLAGLAGIFHETVFQDTDRPALLLLFGGMVGLPAFLRIDEAKGLERIGEK
jgi:hypothetical protein